MKTNYQKSLSVEKTRQMNMVVERANKQITIIIVA